MTKICVNSELFSILSLAPSSFNILYLTLLSLARLNSPIASMVALVIANVIPKYNPINVNIAFNPILDDSISILVLKSKLAFVFLWKSINTYSLKFFSKDSKSLVST